MELHYLTLLRQTEFLRPYLSGSKIISCYTQSKNEMIVQFRKGDSYPGELALSSDATYPYILLREERKRSSRSTEVIGELTGKIIENVSIVRNDRVIEITFRDWQYKFVLQYFRNRTNFFLIDSDGMIRNAFKHGKKHIDNRFTVTGQKKQSPLEISEKAFAELCKEYGKVSIEQLLKKHFIFFTGYIPEEINRRSAIELLTPVEMLNNHRIDLLFHTVKEFFEDCLTDYPRIYLKNDYPKAFALTALQIYEPFDSRPFETVNDALSFFIFRRRKRQRIIGKRQHLAQLIEGKIRQLDQLIAHLRSLPDENEQRQRLQKHGELLLAQMVSLSPGVSEVELTDLFDPEQKKIWIRLDPELSIQENAQVFFRKAKDVAANMRQVKKNIKENQKKLDQLHHFRSVIENDLEYKNLLQIEKKLIDMHIIQTDDQRMEEAYRPYRQYYSDNFEIWVGRNARSNDEMTFHHAHKEDMWLHAQGVGGSHVIIRRTDKRGEVPKKIIEYAARLAAGHSQAKTSSYVPVMVTQVKYVRKPKGSSPGAVNAERAKTVFVEPLAE